MSLPTLDDLKAHLNDTGGADDAELLPMLDAAVEVVEGIAGPLSAGDVTETHYGVASRLLVLRKAPVSAVAAVSVTPAGGVATAWTADAYTLDGDLGALRSVAGMFFGDVTVTYTVTPVATPAAVSLAILVVAAHLWETQRGAGPSPIPGQPDSGEVFAPGVGYAIPNRARELLTPFIVPNVA